MRMIVRAPSHLGDGVMAEPAIRALAALGSEVVVQAPPWGDAIYPGIVVRRPEAAAPDIAVLLAPSLRAAWQLRRARRRIGLATDFRGPMLTDIVVPARHRQATYARIAAVVGAQVTRAPRVSTGAPCPPELPAGHVGIAPVSRSGSVVSWEGYEALIARIGRPVIAYGAPDERTEVHRVAPSADHRFVGLPIDVQIAAFGRCAVLVANDSGLAHLARAAGVPTVVVFGSTSPERTGADGAIAVEGQDPGCRPCYRKRCARGDHACLRVPVDRVFGEVERLLALGGAGG